MSTPKATAPAQVSGKRNPPTEATDTHPGNYVTRQSLNEMLHRGQPAKISDNLVKEVMGLVNACNATEPPLPEHARKRLQQAVAQHTPGPWRILHSSLVVGNSDKLDTPIAEVLTVGNGGAVALNEATANAEIICLAVNCHADLLDACKHAARSEHHPACKCHGEFAAYPQYCTCHVQKARSAIAKTERGAA